MTGGIMRKAPVLAIVLAAFAQLPTSAQAQEETRDATRADLRCALTMTVIMRDEQYRQSAGYGLYYFVGRLEARDPSLDLTSALRREAGQMQSSQWNGEIQRCAAEVQAKTKSLEDLKTAFAKRGTGR